MPEGNAEFQFKAGNFDFKSTGYEWRVVSGSRARDKGKGLINSNPDTQYQFVLTAVDGGLQGTSPDQSRIEISYEDPATGLSTVIYNNQTAARQ